MLRIALAFSLALAAFPLAAQKAPVSTKTVCIEGTSPPVCTVELCQPPRMWVEHQDASGYYLVCELPAPPATACEVRISYSQSNPEGAVALVDPACNSVDLKRALVAVLARMNPPPCPYAPVTCSYLGWPQ